METPIFSHFATGSMETMLMLCRMKQAKQDEMRKNIETKTGPVDIQFTFRKLVDVPSGIAIVDIWEARADIGIPLLVGLPPRE